MPYCSFLQYIISEVLVQLIVGYKLFISCRCMNSVEMPASSLPFNFSDLLKTRNGSAKVMSDGLTYLLFRSPKLMTDTIKFCSYLPGFQPAVFAVSDQTEVPETIGGILGGYCKVEDLLGTKQKCLRPSVASWVGIVKWRTYLGSNRSA